MADASASTSPSLRAAGMRQTPQREGILQVLRDSDRPLTVEEIWERMPERRSGLPTVYRNLERFVREGWAESILGADQIMRFVRCESRHHHHHLQCEHCGRTVEVDACGLDESLRHLEALSGFKITRHQLQLFGLCATCRSEKDR
ncbi:MAG: transcriptional repressor [Geothrix sp.]|jgi:Fe2+ or Zn2+ uptake regulation protein|uniref:Transcriptional repressor n=1 Tax=Candidatus Geothrix odensensis TaxID=2954440 RepID=A0A936K571_9BACT|nr:transcriptional repressor [Candidatus Geothrix odensensis]MBP7619133.1 transcriptional repressor [Geothrix sp.]